MFWAYYLTFYTDKEIIIVYFWILIKELLSLFRHQKELFE